MKLNLLILIFFSGLIFSNNLTAQIELDENALIIYDETGFVNSDEQGLFHYLFSIKSKDSLFKYDGYKFIINSRTDFEHYSDLKEIGEEVLLDRLQYVNISSLAKYTNCELHNYLSKQKKIYLILTNRNSAKKIVSYIKYPAIYTGTQKNIEMLKM